MAAGLEIHEAAATGDLDSLEEFLKTGKVDVNLKDEEWGDRTALHWACAKGYVECIRLLLDHGASGTARTDTGWTPAHMAAETGKLTALRALFNASIPIGLKDTYGDRPRRIAEIYGYSECVKFLEQCEVEEALNPTGMSSRVGSLLRSRRLQAARQVPAMSGVMANFTKLGKSRQTRPGSGSLSPGPDRPDGDTQKQWFGRRPHHSDDTVSDGPTCKAVSTSSSLKKHSIADDDIISLNDTVAAQ